MEYEKTNRLIDVNDFRLLIATITRNRIILHAKCISWGQFEISLRLFTLRFVPIDNDFLIDFLLLFFSYKTQHGGTMRNGIGHETKENMMFL